MSFFIRNKKNSGTGMKRKVEKKHDSKIKTSKSISSKAPIPKKTNVTDDGDISDEIDSDIEVNDKEEISDSDEEETAQEKRLRLTKQYLSQLEQTEADDEEDNEQRRDLIGDRLRQDVLEQNFRHHRNIADKYSTDPKDHEITVLKGHKLSVTCSVISPDSKHIFSASKDCSIIKYCLKTGTKLHTVPGGRKGTKHRGHTDHVLCMAISSDGKYLASGDKNNLIHIWNPETCQLIHTFTGHRGPVAGLAFRHGSHQLFSGSHDRSVKIWSLDEMGYIETLFGHEDAITAIDSLARDRAISSGGRDGSVRIWKVVEESQLVFHGNNEMIECVSLCNEDNFVTSSCNNSLSLWSVMKKKPLVTVRNAHGVIGQSVDSSSENWITAVTALKCADLIASGSKDGCIRLWKVGENFKSLTLHCVIPVTGFINSLQFSCDGKLLIASVGQEHKLGRWWSMKSAKNLVFIIKLKICSE